MKPVSASAIERISVGSHSDGDGSVSLFVPRGGGDVQIDVSPGLLAPRDSTASATLSWEEFSRVLAVVRRVLAVGRTRDGHSLRLGDDHLSLEVYYTNRGEPFRDGLEFSLCVDQRTTSAFLEEAELKCLIARVERMAQIQAPLASRVTLAVSADGVVTAHEA